MPASTPTLDEPTPGPRRQLLQQFAVATTAEGLQAIADGHPTWPSGARARRNRDATGSRKVKGDHAELRLPRKDFVSIVERHCPADLEALKQLPGMEVGLRDSLVFTTSESEALVELSDRLIDIALAVHQSSAEPTKQTELDRDHDTEQVLLRASQARVLATELDEQLP